ncbi:glucokinase [Sandaracinobacteroides hominis]|uniref:glucokinase n=1 Tax=Sandaracinobacteroides hominis TaxID=2780086 RepID=UPI0018F6ABBE|nr:glucokinase [Sandaracinobacteroides hominis]
MELVTADIGGTHARFAIATRGADGAIALSDIVKLKVADHASLQSAFEAYRGGLTRAVPAHAAIALAAPTDVELITLANNPWVIRPALAAERLGLESVMFINDFAAVAHAVSKCGPNDLEWLAGPKEGLPETGVVSVIGPGTGLGVAVLLTGADARVVATEGGHMDYAPLDSVEDQILQQLRTRFRRVSVERIVSGSGFANVYAALAAIEGRAVPARDDKALWAAALEEGEALAQSAFDRWCLALGSVVGDLALAQGAEAVVLAGGMLPRVQHLLGGSGFHPRFMAKGRFEARMAAIPILHITHPEPGLLGAAAAAFAKGVS